MSVMSRSKPTTSAGADAGGGVMIPSLDVLVEGPRTPCDDGAPRGSPPAALPGRIDQVVPRPAVVTSAAALLVGSVLLGAGPVAADPAGITAPGIYVVTLSAPP